MAVCAVAHLASIAGASSSLTTSTVDPGGGRAQAGVITMDGGFGPWVDVSESGGLIVRAGHAGQLYDVVGADVSAHAPSVGEEETVEFDVVGRCDDGTHLAPDTENWAMVSGPIATLDGTGHAQAGVVYRSETGTVQATAFGFTAQGRVIVFDTDPDNFGLYAHDDIQDLWQVGYFGSSSTNGVASADPDGDLDDNYFEFTAGTDPLVPQSAFRVSLARSGTLRVSGSPASSNRTYRLERTANLRSGTWAPVIEGLGVYSNGQWVVAGLSHTNPLAHYRMIVEYDWR